MRLSKDKILRPALLKISRAEYHINNLNAELNAYLLKKPLRLMTVGHPKTGKQVHFVKEHIPLPDDIPLIIGDAVHNLRSALDILIFTMIGSNATKPESVQFPFSKRAESLESTMRNRETHLAGKNVVDKIKDLKPYPGGHEFIGDLNVLDITDKHKLIIPTVATAVMSASEFTAIIPSFAVPSNVVINMHKGAVFEVFRPGTRAQRRASRSDIRSGEYEHDVQPAFQIAFDEGQPYQGRTVVPILVEIAKQVRVAAEDLCDAFLRDAA